MHQIDLLVSAVEKRGPSVIGPVPKDSQSQSERQAFAMAFRNQFALRARSAR